MELKKKTAKAPDKIELFFQELNWPFVQQLRKKRKPEVNQKKKKKVKVYKCKMF